MSSVRVAPLYVAGWAPAVVAMNACGLSRLDRMHRCLAMAKKWPLGVIRSLMQGTVVLVAVVVYDLYEG